MNGIAILYSQSNRNVTSLMNCRRITLIFMDREAVTFGSHENSIARKFYVWAAHSLRIVAGGGDRGFVQKICEVRSRESRCATSHPVEIELGVECPFWRACTLVLHRALLRQEG